MAYGFTPSGTLPRAIRVLLLVNVVLFMLDFSTKGQFVRYWLALDPDRTLHQFELWRLFTYLFVHDLSPPFFHILINMLLLWMFGTPLVETMG